MSEVDDVAANIDRAVLVVREGVAIDRAIATAMESESDKASLRNVSTIPPGGEITFAGENLAESLQLKRPGAFQFLDRFDRDRIIRQCDAIDRVLDRHVGVRAARTPSPQPSDIARLRVTYDVVAMLAGIYSDEYEDLGAEPELFHL